MGHSCVLGSGIITRTVPLNSSSDLTIHSKKKRGAGGSRFDIYTTQHYIHENML